MTTTTATLTVAEADQLADCEAVIAKGLQTFIEVGQALLTIRDNRLYRTSYGTFEEYCRKTWGMDRVSAHRTIEAAQVAEVLSMDNTYPANVGQARELAPLKDDPDAMRAVWETANERTDGKPTAKVIRECREELTAEPEILDAEVVEDLPPVDERQQWEARLNEEVFLIDKAIGRIHTLTGWGHDPSKAARVVEDLEYLLDIIKSNLEMIRNYLPGAVNKDDRPEESASLQLANDIRLWLNHLQTEPEMDDLSDREKWHVIEGLRETADALEGQLK